MVDCFTQEESHFLAKGQAALEYMIIVSIALVLITPLIANSRDMIGSITETRQTSIMADALNSLERTVKLVRSQGEPSRITIRVEIPENVVSSNVTSNRIHYRMELSNGETDFYRFFGFNVSGDLPTNRGVHEITVRSDGGEVVLGYDE